MHKLPQNLRLAFFGSDLFSLASLKRLVEIKATTDYISHIDVFTRSIKPTGRKLKTFVDVPIGEYAQKVGLPLFRVDSALEINQYSNQDYDLAVAVSYGKLIPGHFLSKLRNGGLNVHPSLLPEYSGSSPIQYAIMDDRKTTGVTVQTLHPTKFDHGDIIHQSLEIEIGLNEKFDQLRDRLAFIGADLLEQVIANTNTIPNTGNTPSTNMTTKIPKRPYSLAPKIPPTLAEIRWNTMKSRQICRLEDALGALFSYKAVDVIKKKIHKTEPAKIILEDFAEEPGIPAYECLSKPGEFYYHENKLIVKSLDSYISIGKLKYQFCNYEEPKAFMANLKLRTGDTPHSFQEASKGSENMI